MKKISETNKNKMAETLMNKAKENVEKFGCTLDEGLKIAVKRLMNEYPIAAIAFIK